MGQQMNRITPMLWFDGQAEEAARFYASVFRKRAKLGKPMKSGGKVLVMPVEIDGLEFSCLNGGPQFKFNESVSFVIHCKDQKEVDYFWEKLAAGGEESMCGWLKDKYGVSWQVTPDILLEMMRGPNAAAVMRTFMQMRKFDIATLVRVGRHRIKTRPSRKRVRVMFQGELIAESRDTLVMHEGTYPAVYYFPRRDVKMDRLQRSSHRTHCPFKGDASYFSLKDGPANSVWSYEAPFDEANAIKQRLAFYADKFEISPS